MDVTPLIPKGQQIIQQYAQGFFKISGIVHDYPVLVTPQETKRWDIKGTDFQNLAMDDFHILQQFKEHFDVFILGCGDEMAFLPENIKGELKNQGLYFDVMPTGAACRTYNVLMAEGRRVIVMMLPVRGKQR